MIYLRTLFFSWLALLLVLPGGYAWADTSEFNISVLAGGDIVPPTTPTLLTVDPVGANQIDITWSVATDDNFLAGYVLRRDGVAIATTTLTSYIDSSLSPETLYSYEVYAYDAFNNISTTSNSLATTTLALPIVVVTSPTPSKSSGSIIFRLLDFSLETDLRGVSLTWETSNPARYTLRWGRSQDYETGFIANDIYRQNQKTTINDLEPGTTYLYELIGYDARGIEHKLKIGQFKTETLEAVSPVNVQAFQAEVEKGDVRLDWEWPEGAVGAKVRVVRNYYGYPANIYDGAVVYEGTGKSVLDQAALAEKQSQYYTAFLIWPDGSVSSGAVVRVFQTSPGDPAGPVPLPGEAVLPLPILPDLPLPEFDFSTAAILLKQGSTITNFASNNPELTGDEPFLISIAKAALPDHLKSIVVSITDPTNDNRTFSFLLRINKDLTAYEATIAPLKSYGSSRIVVEIFDYEQLVVGRYQKGLQFVPEVVTEPVVVFPDQIVKAGPIWLVGGLVILAIVVWLLWFIWRRRQAEDKQ